MTNLTHNYFFVYVYSKSLHVSSTHVLIIRRLIVSIRHLVYVTVCRWPSGTQVWVEPKPAYQTVTYIQWHIPDIVLIQLISWWWAQVLETCRDLE